MESTGDKYAVLLYPKAYRDLDGIYAYISKDLLEPDIARRQINRIWNALESLSSFPYSHQDRLVGRYANKGYKQFVVGNYLILFRVAEEKKEVHVVTIQYVRRNL